MPPSRPIGLVNLMVFKTLTTTVFATISLLRSEHLESFELTIDLNTQIFPGSGKMF